MTEFKPMTMVELAQELNVPLTQRGRPNLRDHVPSRLISREEAQARGLSLYWESAACRFGHQAARSVANDSCVDCLRVREGRDPIYPKSKAQEFRKATKPTKAEAAAAPVVIQQPTAPELSASDLKFLAKLDELRDFDAAAKAAGTTRGLVEARASSYPLFRTALEDLCTRRDIPWTRAMDPQAFKWTAAIERQFVKRYIDCGLLEQTRQELGVSASEYHAHLGKSRDFAASITAASPIARQTLRERATAAAERGNDRLLKALQDDPQAGVFTDVFGNQQSYCDPEAERRELAEMIATAQKKLDAQKKLREQCIARQSKNPPVVEDPDDLTYDSSIETIEVSQ